VNAGAPINTTSDDAHANFSRDGHRLLVSSTRQGGLSDIYISHRTDTHDDFAWGPLVPLGGDVNTSAFEAAPSYMATAEAGPTNLYFTRGPDANNTDIYSVAITRDGKTLGPAQLVAISSTSPETNRDAHPTLRVDGLEVIFYATRPDFAGIDLMVSTRPNLRAAWSTPVNLGAPINSAATDIHPTLSFDGRTLLWSSDRPGSLPGGRDIWMATRTRIGGDDDDDGDDRHGRGKCHFEFSARLSAAEEVPTNASEARGQSIFFTSDGASIRFRLKVANIQNVLQAHIHVAAAGVNGPVVVFLYPPAPPAVLIPGPFDGTLGEGTFTAANLRGPLAGMTVPDLLAHMVAGNTYANVHTSQFTGGEIRGQIRQKGRDGHDDDDHHGGHNRGHHDDDHGHHGGR